MMQLIKVISTLTFLSISTHAFADAICENRAKTRDDFLSCTDADTRKLLTDSEKLYRGVKRLATKEQQASLEKNFKIWNEKFDSDCSVVALAFNDWGNDYAPDTDFQVAECRKNIASQKLEFYEWLTCPDDMETSDKPKCPAIHEVLSKP